MDELDYQVERRIEIYKNELFVKVHPPSLHLARVDGDSTLVQIQ